MKQHLEERCWKVLQRYSRLGDCAINQHDERIIHSYMRQSTELEPLTKMFDAISEEKIKLARGEGVEGGLRSDKMMVPHH